MNLSFFGDSWVGFGILTMNGYRMEAEDRRGHLRWFVAATTWNIQEPQVLMLGLGQADMSYQIEQLVLELCDPAAAVAHSG